MATVYTNPNDFDGLVVRRLAKLSSLDMTTAAVFNAYVNGPNTILLCYCVLRNFSAFPDGALLPATWAFTYGSVPNGSAAPTAPTNLKTAQTISGSPSPYVIAQSITTQNGYLEPWYTLYFAISTATNGVGTFDVTFYGGILAK